MLVHGLWLCVVYFLASQNLSLNVSLYPPARQPCNIHLRVGVCRVSCGVRLRGSMHPRRCHAVVLWMLKLA